MVCVGSLTNRNADQSMLTLWEGTGVLKKTLGCLVSARLSSAQVRTAEPLGEDRQFTLRYHLPASLWLGSSFSLCDLRSLADVLLVIAGTLVVNSLVLRSQGPGLSLETAS